MDYTQKINTIKTLTNDNKNSQFICDKLKIPKYDFYNICNREKIKYIREQEEQKIKMKLRGEII
jgi:hypothetical protein